MKKKDLAVLLSGLLSFGGKELKLEQHQTDGEIAADVLWRAFIEGNVVGKLAADFGCGNGVLGIGALILGGRKVIFLDRDEEAVSLAKKNLELVQKCVGKRFDSEFIKEDVVDFNRKVDVVIMNPPFGVKKRGADIVFLGKAFECAEVVYSLHKIEGKGFLGNFALENYFNDTLLAEYDFPLRKSKAWHRKKVHYVRVGLWRFEKKI